jgi:hypothetical protein
MFRKLALLLLVLVLTLPLFTGCQKEAGTIKIGLEGPMTGDYAYEGQGFEKAVKLLAEPSPPPRSTTRPACSTSPPPRPPRG